MTESIGYIPHHRKAAVRNAAYHAQMHVFPDSALGDYLAAELRAYVEFGKAFPGGITERVADEITRMHNEGVVHELPAA